MSFDLNAAGSYGSGSLGDVTDPPAPYINAYAAVEEFHTNYFYATPIYETDYLSWDNCIGCQVLFHAVAAKSGNSSYLGQYLFNTITGREEDDDGIRFNVAEPMASLTSKDSTIFWQAILIPEFKNLTLQSKNLKPLSYALNNVPLGGMNPYLAPCGGLLVFKCSDTLTLAGGHIDLRDAGFPTNVSTTYRPNLSHENYGTLDTDQLSGSENSITKDRLLLNAGDGACFILAKTINCSSGSSRIGNPSTSGVQYCRGAADSTGLPANVTNLGGSSIAIVTHLFNNFSPNLIAKYRSGSTGRGLARAYLAVLNAHNSPKPDEGLYALDTISRTDRVKSMCNISGFGKGSDGSYSLAADARKCWNSYAKVTAISGRVYSITRVSADVEELTNFEVGRLVLIHQSRTASANDWQDGRFFLSRITAISGSTVTIKHNFTFNLSTYNVQMIVVPEFQNLTLPTEYKNTPRYSRGAGGIFAIAVNGTCNLSGGKINLEGKGTFSSVVNPIISNYSMKGSLPLGQGNGSVFILARNLTMNTSTRIGATYDGSIFGGRGGAGDKSSYPAGGGYSGSPGASSSGEKNPGWGGGAGIHPDYDELSGGWHSNAGTADYAEENGGSTGCQGAHILIVADSISGFNLSALSTGGGSGYAPGNYGQEPGGCGYGGGGKIIANNGGTAGAGGYQGGGVGVDFITKLKSGDVSCGGGGAAGAAFVYANNISEQVTTGIVLF